MPSQFWWIKVRVDLSEDVKVLQIAGRTGLDPEAVVGRLVRLWGWALRHMRNGSATGELVAPTLRFLRNLVTPDCFLDAVTEVGWLSVTEERICFPGFGKYIGQPVRENDLAAERMRRMRQRNKKGNKAPNKTPAVAPQRRGEEKEDNASALSSPEAGGKGVTKRPPNELWDVVCEVFGLSPKTRGEEKRVGKVAADLKLKEATPEQVRALAGKFGETWPGITCTPEALLKHWDQLGRANDGTGRCAGRVGGAGGKYAAVARPVVPEAAAEAGATPLFPAEQGPDGGGDRAGAAGGDA